MSGTVMLLMPTAEKEPVTASRLAPRLDTLKGKTVGFVDNVIWTSTRTTFQEFEKGLRAKYGVTGAVYHDKPSQGASRESLREFAQQVDAAIVGLGN